MSKTTSASHCKSLKNPSLTYIGDNSDDTSDKGGIYKYRGYTGYKI